MQFGNVFTIRPLCWKDFTGRVDDKMPWSAHIYWYIEYKVDTDKLKVEANLVIGKNSWVR